MIVILKNLISSLETINSQLAEINEDELNAELERLQVLKEMKAGVSELIDELNEYFGN